MLSIKQLSFSYEEKKIINMFSGEIKGGQSVALLGKNGAGKSTLLSILIKKLQSNEGVIALHTEDIAFLPQGNDLMDGVTVNELINFQRSLFKNPLDIEEALDMFEVRKLLNKRTETLSGGQKRRVNLTLLFISNPKLMILDEPTTGLEMDARQTLYKEVKKFINKDKAVLFTSHSYEEVEYMANHLWILKDGRLQYDGVPDINSITVMQLETENKNILAVLNQSLNVRMWKNQSNDLYYVQTSKPDNLLKELTTLNIEFTLIERRNIDWYEYVNSPEEAL